MNKPMPSLKRLEKAFPGKGAELRALLKKDTRTDSYEAVIAYVKACYYPPSYGNRLMVALNDITEGCGIEYLRNKQGYAVAEYINHGDPYVMTIIRKLDTGTIILGCWGDFVEANRL